MLKDVQLADEGVHAIALLINVSMRIKSQIIKFLGDSWLFSSTFVLFTHAKPMEWSNQKIMELLQDPHCSDFKRLMQLIGCRFIMLESKNPVTMTANLMNS